MRLRVEYLLLTALFATVAEQANAISVSVDAGQTMTSTPGAVTFYDFDGIQVTSIGTFSGGQVGPDTPGMATAPASGNFISAYDSSPVMLTLVNPVSYIGFVWGTPDPENQVDVYNGTTLLGSFFAVTSLFPRYYFNISAGPGEAITSLVLKFNAFPNDRIGWFETDNYAAISSVPGPVAGAGLPGMLTMMLASGGLCWWRRRQKTT